MGTLPVDLSRSWGTSELVVVGVGVFLPFGMGFGDGDWVFSLGFGFVVCVFYISIILCSKT